MSDLNKELNRKAFDEIWNKANLAIINQIYGADYIHRATAFSETAGLEPLKQVVLALRAAFPNGHFALENVISEADLVVSRWRFTGTHEGAWMGMPATGKAVNFTGTSVVRVAGGRIVEQVSADWDVLAMWQQLGLLGDLAVLAANKDLVRRNMEEIWNGGNLALVDEIFTADCVMHILQGPELRGAEARKQWVNSARGAFPDMHFTINELIAEEDKVVLRWSVRETHLGEWLGAPATGKVVNGTGTSTFRIAGGRIADEEVQWDALGFMRQMGLTSLLGEPRGTAASAS